MKNLLSSTWWKTATPQQLTEELKDITNINIRDDEGNTPFLLAASYNSDPKVLQILLEAGADIETQNWISGSALACAAEHNPNPQITKFLIENGLSVHDENLIAEMTPLILAIQNKNFEVAKLLIEHGSDIDIKDNTGYSALDYANIDKENMSFLEFLKKHQEKQKPLDLSEMTYHHMTAAQTLAYLSKDNSQDDESVSNILSLLTPREERLIRMWFGIGYPKAQSLCEIGEYFHVTATRVGQIMSKALRKLQRSSLADKFSKVSVFPETPEALLARFVQYNPKDEQ